MSSIVEANESNNSQRMSPNSITKMLFFFNVESSKMSLSKYIRAIFMSIDVV